MKDKESSGKAKGGIARAKVLSPDQRKEIGRRAAQARWSIPKANYEGVLKIANTEIPCAVYERDDKVLRLIVQREVVGLLTGNKKGNLDRYLAAKNLQEFVPEKFKGKALDQASIVLEIGGKKAHCYEGEDIVDLCKMYLDARKRGKITLSTQVNLADRAEILVTSLAKTGITGLIDEATGYQQFRARDALQAYLDRVLRSELAAWVKTFPDEFFFQIYRLKKWSWSGSSRRPPVVGRYITDLVYSRLGPGILAELESRNPKLPSGKRAAKHFQWLTEDIGHPALAQHLYSLIGFMKASDTWDEFKRMTDRVYKKPEKDSPQLYLPGLGPASN